MTNEKEIALTINIMILSVIKFIEEPNKTVASASKTMYDKLQKKYLRPTGKFEVYKVANLFVRKEIKRADPEYVEINNKVIDAWDKTRRELVQPDGQLFSYTSEIIQVLWDRLKNNKHKNIIIGTKRLEGVIEAIANASDKEEITEEEMTEAYNNSRALANRFLEIVNIAPVNTLARRKYIIEQNLILDGKIK